jgi:nucleoside-diphosphate-sugar epimerase
MADTGGRKDLEEAEYWFGWAREFYKDYLKTHPEPPLKNNSFEGPSLIMAPTKVIIFGATGAVGSAAARYASEYGAKVYLAMRDTSKATPNLPSDQGFEKVQADLTKPDTIHAAVTKTGAKHAFIYIAFGMNDFMKSSLLALKSAGIEFVAFLSSNGVQGELEKIGTHDYIGYSHAQVELNLKEVFGEKGYVAVRPGWFASNILRWKIEGNEVKVLYPEAKFDFIVPGDIGRVCGAFVAGGWKGENIVRLRGPRLTTQREAIEIVGKVLGKDLKVKEIDEAAGLKLFVEVTKLPVPVAEHLVEMLRESEVPSYMYVGKENEEAPGNILKYGGKKPTTFEEWVAANKKDFGV